MSRTQVPLSARVAGLRASPIRDILAVIDRPGMVSFAGGLPAAETFPPFGASAPPREILQYGPSEGEPVLRERIAGELRGRGLDCEPEQVIVLSGSQQGIDLVAKLFIDPGTPVAVESPTYLAALQVFRFFGADLRAFDVGADDGPAACIRDAAFTYVIPNFQNPSGHCYSAAEREALALACDRSGTTLFEDDPYRDLAYDPCDTSPIAGRLERASWIYQGSFSKSFAPGLRLGYLASSRDLLPYLVRLKQAADLHSNRISQWWVLQQLADPDRAARLARLVASYRERRDAFARSLQRHFGELARWELPPGGLFFWLLLDPELALDTQALLAPALERGVAFMPGEPFYPAPQACANAMRLNFSHADPMDAERGLETLAALLRESAAHGRAVSA